MRDNSRTPNHLLEIIVPTSFILISLLILSPLSSFFGAACLPLRLVVFIHVISYLALGLCFELPELSFNALCLYWAKQKEDFASRFAAVAAILRIRYVLTHFIGPTTGILTVASGIYLAYRGARSFSEGWLFWILIAASIGLYKGMYQHNAYLKHLLHLSRDPANADRLKKCILNPFDQSLIFLELPTYIFIYWAASIKPVWFHNPLSGWTGTLEQSTSVWWTGVIFLAIGSIILLPLNWSVSRFSSVYNDR